ncbi:C-type lectin domain family 2 member D3-like [Ochotona princeps]|uniref:C-type lectin domain family 2 member D3-like n=1 Tax=Ochotona princeps TaxID=9978 RepID=UPI00271543A0|nr:C-type lectin domain family 2 member D3-like [Ochotona princeps]
MLTEVFQKFHKGSTQDKKSTEGNNTSSVGSEDGSVVPSFTGLRSVFKKITTERTLSSWHCFRTHCYYFSKQEVTWEESKKLCQNTRSRLVKIDDKEEQNYIQSKIKYSYWIGLYRTESEHKWKWQDGTEPSDQLAFQQTNKMDGKCGCLKPRFIDSADCTRQLPYICEKNKRFFNN